MMLCFIQLIIGYAFFHHLVNSTNAFVDITALNSAKLNIADTSESLSACDLAIAEIRKYTGRSNISMISYKGMINDSLIKRHIIVILSAADFFVDGAYLPFQTYIINSDNDVAILSIDPEKVFNCMITAESLKVVNFDVAVEIAKLFVRCMLPLVSDEPNFFLDELVSPNYNDLVNKANRNEIVEWALVNFDDVFEESRRKSTNDINRHKWFSKISKKGTIYTVNLLTAGSVYCGSGRHLIYRYKVLNWEVKVYDNGIIKTRLPKGVKVYKP